jgi:hypothetical protein
MQYLGMFLATIDEPVTVAYYLKNKVSQSLRIHMNKTLHPNAEKSIRICAMAVQRMIPGRWQPRPTGGQEIILQYASSSTYYTATVDECWFGQIRIRLLTEGRARKPPSFMPDSYPHFTK